MPDRVKLTEAQKSVLCTAITSRTRIVFASERDATMNSLGRKGLADWVSMLGSRYSRSHWWITDDGMTAGALLASNAKGE